MTAPLRIGTRASRLARWQTDRIAGLLHAAGFATEAVEIRTTGDLVGDVPLPRIGDRALFTRQLDEALLDERIDLAVHSLKDLPTQLPDGVVIAAIGERADPRDALVARRPAALASLVTCAVVATRREGRHPVLPPSCSARDRTCRCPTCVATWRRACRSWTSMTTGRPLFLPRPGLTASAWAIASASGCPST